MNSEYMTGREIVNIMDKLRELGHMSDTEILDFIRYVETNVPKPLDPQ